MTEHPAHRMAQVAADAAAELRGYLDPGVTIPWELTEDDHRAIVARLHDAISELAMCIEGIAQATGDERAHRQLTDAVARMRHGCVHISAAAATLGRPDDQSRPRAHVVTRPALLSARDFPAAMTSDVLRAGTDEPLQPPGPQLTAIPGGRHADSPRRHNPRTM
jgi:hypothetical protein